MELRMPEDKRKAVSLSVFLRQILEVTEMQLIEIIEIK